MTNLSGSDIPRPKRHPVVECVDFGDSLIDVIFPKRGGNRHDPVLILEGELKDEYNKYFPIQWSGVHRP